jgi:O-antigen/teichoic acid export membrane protein
MHYGLENLRHSLRHFFIGKAATAVTAVVLLLLLARWLSKEDYAVYVSLQAVLVIISYATTFGVSQSLLRFIPELRVANNNLPLYRKVVHSLVVQSVAIAAGFFVVALALPWLEQWFNLHAWREWVYLYLVVGWLRLTGQFLGRIMETLLWQKQSQYSQATGSFLRLLAIALAAKFGVLDIPTLFVIELAAEILILILLLLGYTRKWRADPHRHEGDPDWWKTHEARSRRYAFWSYLSSIASVLAGSAPYRLVAARLLAPEGVALFGFATGMMDMLNRYTPTRLMQGTIRSILVARFSEHNDQQDLVAKLRLNFQVNALMLAVLAAFALAAAGPVLNWLTQGKYSEANVILAALIGVLVLDVLRAQYELLAEVVERNQWTVAGNMVLGLGVASALLATPYWGMPGLILGAVLGEAAALAVMIAGLRHFGAARVLEGRIVLVVPALFLAGWIGDYLAASGGIGHALALAVTLVLIAGVLLVLRPISRSQAAAMVHMVRERKGTAR